MEPDSISEVKKTEQTAGGKSDLGLGVAAVLLVAFVLFVYLSFQFAFDWVIEYLPEWVYYSLVIVGLFIWVGDLLRRASDWIEKDLARMDAKMKSKETKTP